MPFRTQESRPAEGEKAVREDLELRLAAAEAACAEADALRAAAETARRKAEAQVGSRLAAPPRAQTLGHLWHASYQAAWHRDEQAGGV